MNAIAGNYNASTFSERSMPRPFTEAASSTSRSQEERRAAPGGIYDTAKRYDVRAITPDESIAMSEELYAMGEISLQEHMALSFDARPLGKGDIYLTQPNAMGQLDLLAEYKARMELSQAMSEPKSLQINGRVFDLLLKLQALHNQGPLNLSI